MLTFTLRAPGCFTDGSLIFFLLSFQVSLVVNVATLCGFTDSTYKDLKKLHDILGFGGKFNVLAFPCNQFGDQEPYENEVILNFAKTNYAVEFPMFSKIDVIGEHAHPAYKSLISKTKKLLNPPLATS